MFARSLRTMFAAALVTLSVVPAAAFADSPTNAGDASTHVRQDKKGKEAFPMAASTFKTKVENRIEKARERISERMAKKNVPADKQKVVLTKYDAGSAKVMLEVDKVGADGTVTKEEAQQVRTLARELRGHGGKGHKHDTPARGQK